MGAASIWWQDEFAVRNWALDMKRRCRVKSATCILLTAGWMALAINDGVSGGGGILCCGMAAFSTLLGTLFHQLGMIVEDEFLA